LIKKGYRKGPGSGNLGESLVKATISQRKYQYQNHRKITYKKTNFLCVYPLPVLRPDLDSSQDSRKVSQGIFQKKIKNWRSYRGEKFSALWIRGKCQGGDGITAYAVRPHAPDGAPTVGAARIGRGAVLERRAATCGLQNPLRPEWFNIVFGCFGGFWRRVRP
jgi:hypothetical protein